MNMPEVINVAIVGATGTIGSSIVPCLLRSKDPVFVSLRAYNSRVIMLITLYRRLQLWSVRTVRKQKKQRNCWASIILLGSISPGLRMISSPP